MFVRYGNSRIHRMKKGTLKNCIAKHSEDSLYKEKDAEKLEICLIEYEYRTIIASFKLPVSAKIL
jgi:hypothetical protein